MPAADPRTSPDPPLDGARVLIAGSLASMPRREAAALLRSHGAVAAAKLDDAVRLVVVSDDTQDWRTKLPDAPASPDFEVIGETELWRRLGMLDPAGQERLYTPAMLAEVVGAPVEAILRWCRRGYLHATQTVGRLPLMGMAEVHVARSLAALLAEGCSQSRIDKLVAQLTADSTDLERPLADLAVVAGEGRILIRRGEDLAEPSGQLLLDFDNTEPEEDAPPASIAFAPRLAMTGGQAAGDEATGDDASDPLVMEMPTADQARSLALDLQADGDLDGAIEACRAAVFAGGDAEDQVLLAQLLYQSGESQAARERYYVALEFDPSDLEARLSLGCLLAEEGELELAEAALRGVLAQQPGLADAHYHLARTLDELGRGDEATHHWRQFLDLAPASPWSEEATDRLSTTGEGL